MILLSYMNLTNRTHLLSLMEPKLLPESWLADQSVPRASFSISKSNLKEELVLCPLSN
jgi:hypothetical protein